MHKKTVSKILFALVLISVLTLASSLHTFVRARSMTSASDPDVAVLEAGGARLRVPDPVFGMAIPVFVAYENQGPSEIGTFDVIAFYDTTLIGTTTVYNLDPTKWDAVYIQWNLESLPNGVYAISANASVLPGETDTADNSFVNGDVLKALFADVTGDGSVDVFDLFSVGQAYASTTLTGDLNSDGIVNWTDVYIFSGAYPSSSTYPNWNPYADFDLDDDVDYDDFNQLAAYMLKSGDPNWNLHADMNADNTIALSDLLDLSQNYGATGP